MVQQCMYFELERAVMRIAFATLALALSVRSFWKSVLTYMVLGVSSTLLILMDRALRLREFIKSPIYFQEPLTSKRYRDLNKCQIFSRSLEIHYKIHQRLEGLHQIQ